MLSCLGLVVINDDKIIAQVDFRLMDVDDGWWWWLNSSGSRIIVVAGEKNNNKIVKQNHERSLAETEFHLDVDP